MSGTLHQGGYQQRERGGASDIHGKKTCLFSLSIFSSLWFFVLVGFGFF